MASNGARFLQQQEHTCCSRNNNLVLAIDTRARSLLCARRVESVGDAVDHIRGKQFKLFRSPCDRVVVVLCTQYSTVVPCVTTKPEAAACAPVQGACPLR